MDDLRNILIGLTNKHSMINFGRMLEVRYHDLYEKVNSYHIGNSFNEKVYCIINELSDIPYNQILNKPYTFINYTKGYGNYDPIITEFSDNDIKYLKDNVKFDKTVKRYKPNLYYLVLQKTKFLDDKVSLQERVYCILNNITIRPDGKFYDLDKGYSTEEDDKLNYIISLANKVGSNDIKHGRKINEFLKRNIKNNYEGIEGYDYVVCPVLNVKMNMIKSNYIENYLLMTVEDFEKKYPNTKRTCDKRIENIKNGIHEIDQETGKTKHQLAMKKAVITKNIVGEDGKTINDKIGEKTRATHMKNVDEHGRNGYAQAAQARNDTILPNGMSVQQNSLLKAKETMIRLNKSFSNGASERSKLEFKHIIQLLDDYSIKYYFGDKSKGQNEYVVTYNSSTFKYDLVIPKMKLNLEYQGKGWHPYPQMSEEKWNNWIIAKSDKNDYFMNANEKKDYDWNKARVLYKSRGFRTWFIYQDYEKDDIPYIIDEIYTYINTNDINKK